jgi:hypothetical protein
MKPTMKSVVLAIASLLTAGLALGTEAIRFDFSPPFLTNAPVRPPAETNEALAVKVERPYARAGDRWIEIEVEIGRHGGLPELGQGDAVALLLAGSDSGGRASASGTAVQLTAEVFAPGNIKPLAQGAITPPREKGKVLVDLRWLNLKEARLVLKLTESGPARDDSSRPGKEIGVKEINLTAKDTEHPLKAGEKVKILIDVPEGVSNLVHWPVMAGVPFPAGALWSADDVRLVDQNGKEIPSQKEVTGLWAPEGSIQWLRFDALVTPGQGCFMEIKQPTPPFRLRSESYGGQVGHPSAGGELSGKKSPPLEGWLKAGVGSLKLTEQDGKITIATGVSTYILGKGISPIREISLSGKQIAASKNTRGLYVIDQTGRIASASAEEEKMEIEAMGPVASCVRFEGWYKTEKGENLARHITRVECFAGQPFAKITHTLVLSQSTTNLWFKDIGWEFAVEPGSNPQAFFGISRSDFQKSYSVPLNSSTPIPRNADTPILASFVYLLQDQHYLMAHGTNHFLIAKSDPSAPSDKSNILLDGDECGDWSALMGAKGGLMLACKETARQHPKEFEVCKDKINLHLFSNRSGEELDFRSATLIKKWDLAGWYKATCKDIDITNAVAKVSKYNSNALGWSKTHELLVMPVAGARTSDTADQALRVAAQYAWLNTHPVYALADPQWIYKTDVMGPVHPKDTQRFPDWERLIDELIRMWEGRIETWGDYGFVDYFAGPHLEYARDSKYLLPYRYAIRATYTLRSDFWKLYARSGERHIRELAEGTNLKWGDDVVTHWDGNGKIKGLFKFNWEGGDVTAQHSLPFLWEGWPATCIADCSNLENLSLFYQLTGCRRARDIVLEYAEAVKQWWTPAKPRWGEHPMMAMRCFVQAYEFTWDPALRELAEAVTDIFSDPAGPMGLSPSKTFYKLLMSVSGCFDAWRILGTQRYYDFCLKISRHGWQKFLDYPPIEYETTLGKFGSFLYYATRDPVYPEILAMKVRQMMGEYEACKRWIDASKCIFIFQGIPYTEDLMARTGADKTPLASWVGYDECDCPVSIVVCKTNRETLKIDLSGINNKANDVDIQPLKQGASSSLDFSKVTSEAYTGRVAGIAIYKDAPNGAYHISPTGPVPQPPSGPSCRIAAAHSKVPLVVYAPGYWAPAPRQKPAIKWYFLVPTNAQDAQIFFEGTNKLYDPDGMLWKGERTNEMLKGEIDLPANKPGLWAFEPVENLYSIENKLVRVRNLPPFFAARDPQSYFMPPIAWQHEPPHKPVEKPSTNTVYVPGAIETPDNKALFLAGKRSFSFDFAQLPLLKEGTVEFWFKPYWSTFDGVNMGNLDLVKMSSTEKHWILAYSKKSHLLVSSIMMSGPEGRGQMWTTCPKVFTGGEWTHIAWVWGNHAAGGGKPIFTSRIFVNGKGGAYGWQSGNQLPADLPKMFALGSAEAAYDELRVSDMPRYREDFTPPARGREFQLDGNTCILFHFNGDMKGVSGIDGRVFEME